MMSATSNTPAWLRTQHSRTVAQVVSAPRVTALSRRRMRQSVRETARLHLLPPIQ